MRRFTGRKIANEPMDASMTASVLTSTSASKDSAAVPANPPANATPAKKLIA